MLAPCWHWPLGRGPPHLSPDRELAAFTGGFRPSARAQAGLRSGPRLGASSLLFLSLLEPKPAKGRTCSWLNDTALSPSASSWACPLLSSLNQTKHSEYPFPGLPFMPFSSPVTPPSSRHTQHFQVTYIQNTTPHLDFKWPILVEHLPCTSLCFRLES